MGTSDVTRLSSDAADRPSCLIIFEDKTTYYYEGRASSADAATSEAKWQIKKTTITGLTKIIQYARHGRPECIWDNREDYFATVALPFSNSFSISFDGVNDYVALSQADMPSWDSDFSFTGWFRPAGSGLRTLFGFGLSSAVTPYLYFYVNASNQLQASTSAGATPVHPTVLTNGTWYHAGLIRSGNTLMISLNGAIGATASGTFAPFTGVNRVTFGALVRTSPASYFNGYMDETALWNVALTNLQLAEIYGGGNPNNLLSHSAVANLKAMYRMGDEDVFPVATDGVGGNDGLMTNMIAANIVTVVP